MQSVLDQENLLAEGHQVLFLVPGRFAFSLFDLDCSSFNQLRRADNLQAVWRIDGGYDDLRDVSFTAAEALVQIWPHHKVILINAHLLGRFYPPIHSLRILGLLARKDHVAEFARLDITLELISDLTHFICG